jgi:hypothetical protein
MESCIASKKPKPPAPKAAANAEGTPDGSSAPSPVRVEASQKWSASESWQLFLIFALAATLAAPVAIVVGSPASFFCIFVFISIFSFINRTRIFAKLLEQEWIINRTKYFAELLEKEWNIKRKQFFAELLEKEWIIKRKQFFAEQIKQIYFSFTIDPDSIEQQVTSIRLVRHFRANNVAAN